MLPLIDIRPADAMEESMGKARATPSCSPCRLKQAGPRNRAGRDLLRVPARGKPAGQIKQVCVIQGFSTSPKATKMGVKT